MMTVYTEDSLLIALFRAAKTLDVFFSICSDRGSYSCWVGHNIYQNESFADLLLWAYRKMQEIANDKGIKMEEDILVQ